MNDQSAAELYQLRRKIEEMETKIRRLEDILLHIDSNVAATLTRVRNLKR